MEQSANPYVIDRPLHQGQAFFGRQDTLDWTARQLRNSVARSVVLSGQRAIGKTSLLLRLEHTLPIDAFLPVCFDLQGQAADPLGQVLASLAGAVAERANLQPPSVHLFDDQGQFFRQTFLPRFHAVALGSSRRLVLLLDEFEVPDEMGDAELSEMAAVKTLFPFLQSVGGGGSPPASVFAAGRQAGDLSPDPAATLDTTLVGEVGCLDWESAEALVRQAEANDTLRLSDLAVSRILDLTNCHPCWTQLLCWNIWERACMGNRNSVEAPLVDTSSVEEAVPGALAAGDSRLTWRWGGLSRAERTYAAALAEMVGEGEALAEDRVIRAVSRRVAHPCVPELETAPRKLVQRGVLKESEGWGQGAEYGFAAEIFRLWVRQNRPLDAVADASGWTSSAGDRSFEMGMASFSKWEWEEAIRCFREALEANSSHLRARVHLGETLLELGRIDEAVTELRRAHALDPDEAELPLAQALAAQAQAREGKVRLAQRQVPTQGAPASSHGQELHTNAAASAVSPQGSTALVDGTELAPASVVGSICFDVLQWLARVGEALRGARFVEALGLVFPVLIPPALSAVFFYALGVSLARGMNGVTWLPTLFSPSTFYRFGLLSAAVGLVPGLRFSYEFMKCPVLNLELVYLSFHRYAFPFLAVILVYVVFILLAWILQTSVPEEEWEGFAIFFGWIRRLWE